LRHARRSHCSKGKKATVTKTETPTHELLAELLEAVKALRVEVNKINEVLDSEGIDR
jgi:hypothetical protein